MSRARARGNGLLRGARGFTLLELLVVVAITGIAATAVLLTAPGSDAALYRQADTLARHLAHARDEAILGGRGVQVSVDAAGYGFSRQAFANWEPLHEGPFVPRHWAQGVAVQLPDRRERVGFRFDVTGASQPQSVLLVHGAARARVSVDAAGQVQVDARAR